MFTASVTSRIVVRVVSNAGVPSGFAFIRNPNPIAADLMDHGQRTLEFHLTYLHIFKTNHLTIFNLTVLPGLDGGEKIAAARIELAFGF